MRSPNTYDPPKQRAGQSQADWMEDKMKINGKHLKESTVFAGAIAMVALIFYFVSALVGFNRMNPGATPKAFSEVVAEWPRLLELAVVVIAGALW